ncbi:sensor histidine kinase [Polycladidibacter stylochi]|uniref:sensor histidine kinase n=1 Tax=Polycladidibacter stylochi TaxID=1807766 RepID=UPI000AD0A7B8|nr:HAMP domain-containing sensor histidine kinase [Pseudovibrio stylochi]
MSRQSRKQQNSLAMTGGANHRWPLRANGLSFKLLVLTLLFVMLSEVLIFIPSIANYRITWLQDKLNVAGVAASLLQQSSQLDRSMQNSLLTATGALEIRLIEGGEARLIASAMPESHQATKIDITRMAPIQDIWLALRVLIGLDTGNMRVYGQLSSPMNKSVEMLIPYSKLRSAMLAYGFNILLLSLVISIITASLVYLSLRWLLVRPLQQLSTSMQSFAKAPEDLRQKIKPSGRRDELGEAELQLLDMQNKLNRTLHQQKRMADLGLAVSKINHDLRNLLASAQLLMERLETLPDPTVQRITPKLLGTLDRAIQYTTSVLSYGKAEEATPQLRQVQLRPLVDDLFEILGLPQQNQIRYFNEVSKEQRLEADPEQLLRVLLNLARNSVQAMQNDRQSVRPKQLSISAQKKDSALDIIVSDTGPGLSELQREKLFKAFATHGKAGGTGLGLAIAHEIISAHGGKIALVNENSQGACFQISLPLSESP